ncbi:BEN domain-containing protein 3-like [Mercenaria mercenaria]|uniref:BEN domain-containing protein 3-like n=1 Tax=Mercenaria mercenaria TaxID=6596 RepID=UPI00234F63EA|nr:BEN domain-containing protein 3-like [Mercenaria mercenaria]
MQSQLNALEAHVRTLTRDVEKLRRQGEARDKRQQAIIDNQRKTHQLLECLITNMESNKQQNIQTSTPTEITDDESIPQQYQIETDELRMLKNDTSGPGNLAAHLVQRLFPELFGETNLRFHYNWTGGGNLKKGVMCS